MEVPEPNNFELVGSGFDLVKGKNFLRNTSTWVYFYVFHFGVYFCVPFCARQVWPHWARPTEALKLISFSSLDGRSQTVWEILHLLKCPSYHQGFRINAPDVHSRQPSSRACQHTWGIELKAAISYSKLPPCLWWITPCQSKKYFQANLNSQAVNLPLAFHGISTGHQSYAGLAFRRGRPNVIQMNPNFTGQTHHAADSQGSHDFSPSSHIRHWFQGQPWPGPQHTP